MVKVYSKLKNAVAQSFENQKALPFFITLILTFAGFKIGQYIFFNIGDSPVMIWPNAGFDHHLVKPVDINELQAVPNKRAPNGRSFLELLIPPLGRLVLAVACECTTTARFSTQAVLLSFVRKI